MLPEIYEIDRSRSYIDTFGGYNRTENVSEGQFVDMTNISSDHYPAMSARTKREYVIDIDKPNGLFYTDALGYINGTKVYYNGEMILEVNDSVKQIACMGALICIFPDKLVYNTETGNYYDMEAHYKSKGAVYIEPCTLNGNKLEYSTTEPEHTDGAYWLDGNVLKQFSKSYNAWMSVSTSYVRIYERIDGERNESFGEGFEQGDTVTLSGFSDEELNGDFIIYGCSDGYIVIGSIPKNLSTANEISIDRNVPDMDYVIEHNNRLWGCSSKNHEIYSCKLGDPTNWRAYAGLLTDSYAVTVGSYGEFTGAIEHMGNVLFFKEDRIIKIYGTDPSNYTLSETSCRGVEKGSENSLAILNEILYYKSKDGICAYDGTIPQCISGNLGAKRYRNAVAGVTTNKYYVSMQDNDSNSLFVYDQVRGIWTRYDSENIEFMAGSAGNLYYMTDESILCTGIDMKTKGTYPGVYVVIDGEKKGMYPGLFYPGQTFEDNYEDSIEWCAVTGDIGCEYPDNKYISSITMRLMVDRGSTFEAYIQYDSDGLWENILSINDTRKRSINIPVRIRRCDHISLKMCGKGNFRLYSIAKTIETGSEL